MRNFRIWTLDRKKKYYRNSYIRETLKSRKERIRCGKKQNENKLKQKKEKEICK